MAYSRDYPTYADIAAKGFPHDQINLVLENIETHREDPDIYWQWLEHAKPAERIINKDLFRNEADKKADIIWPDGRKE